MSEQIHGQPERKLASFVVTKEVLETARKNLIIGFD
jgi:hypothetical protein